MLNLHNIKKSIMPFAAALLLAGMVSCSDDDNKSTTAEISEADAVDAIDASVASSSNGMAKMASDASSLADVTDVYTDAPTITCGQSYTVNFDAADSLANYSYDYSGTRTYQLDCNGPLPSVFHYNAALNGTYDTPRMYSLDTSTTQFTITGLSVTAAAAIFNGTYVRNGYQESKVLQQRHFNSVLTYTLTNITVNKSNHHITGGTAAVTFVGAGSGGNSYTYSGAITFNGNSTATLVINGNTYTINL